MPKISDLLDAATLAGDELLYLLQAGQDRRINVSDLIAGLTPLTGGGSDTSTLPPLLYYATSGYVPGSGGDDYPALSAAMADGGRVRLPRGQLLISSPVSIPTGAYIVGAGTTIRPSASMTTMLTLSGKGIISNVTCSNQSSLATNAFAITKPVDNNRLSIVDCEVIGFTNGWLVTNGDVIRWERPRGDTCGTFINLSNGGINSAIVEPYFVQGNCIDIGLFSTVQCEGLQVIGGQLLPATSGAFAVRLKSGLSITFDGVIFDQIWAAGANGVLIDGTGAAIRHITFNGCWFGKNATATGTGSLFKTIPGSIEDVNLIGCEFQDAGTYGIEMTAGNGGLTSGFVMTGGRFMGSATADVSLLNSRATFIGTRFTHATATIVTGGGQASYSHVACRNEGAAFQAPTLPYTSLPYVAMSPGSNFTISNELVVLTGGFDVTGASVVRGTLTATGLITGAGAAISAQLLVTSGGFDVTGASVVRGNLSTASSGTITSAGKLTVQSGGFDITGTSAVTGTLTITGLLNTGQITTTALLTVTAGGFDVTGASVVRGNLTATGTMAVNGSNLSITAASSSIDVGSTSTASTVVIDSHTSGNNIDYDARLQFTGGNATVGGGSVAFLTAPAGISGDFSGASVKGATTGVSRFLSARSLDFVNVKDFNAKGDGTTDDTTAFNAAITYAQANKLGIVVPGGNYILSAQLAWTTGAISFKGAGQGLTVLTWTAAASTRGLKFTLDLDLHPVSVSDMSLVTLGTSGTALAIDASPQVTGAGSLGIMLGGITVNRTSPRFVVRDVNIRGDNQPYTHWWDAGISCVAAIIGIVDGVTFEGAYTSGTSGNQTPYRPSVGFSFGDTTCKGQPTQYMITNCTIMGATIGILATCVQGIHIQTCDLVGVTNGVQFDDHLDTGGAQPHCAVMNCHINAVSACIYVNNGAELIAIGNDLYRCTDDGTVTTAIGSGIFIDGTYSTDFIIVGNSFANSSANGGLHCITIHNARNGVIDSNVCRKYTAGEIAGIAIDASSSGVRVGANNHFTVDVGATGSYDYTIQDAGVSSILDGAFLTLTKTASQALTAATAAVVTWSGVGYNKSNNTGWWASGTPGVVTVGINGIYRVTANIVFDTGSSGNRTTEILINGSNYAGAAEAAGASSSTTISQNVVSAPLQLVAGTTVSIRCTSSVACNVLTNIATWFSIERISDL